MIKACKFLSILLLILIVNLAKSQDLKSIEREPKIKSINKIKLYLAGFGLEREQRITDNKSIYFGVAVESVVPFNPKMSYGASDALKIDYSINFAPVFSIGYRNYTNLSERNKNGKKTENNSANYIGIEYNLIAPILINKNYKTNYINSISPVFGFQRSLSKNLNFEIAAGPSLQTDFNNFRISALARAGFSFLIQ